MSSAIMAEFKRKEGGGKQMNRDEQRQREKTGWDGIALCFESQMEPQYERLPALCSPGKWPFNLRTLPLHHSTQRNCLLDVKEFLECLSDAAGWSAEGGRIWLRHASPLLNNLSNDEALASRLVFTAVQTNQTGSFWCRWSWKVAFHHCYQ